MGQRKRGRPGKPAKKVVAAPQRSSTVTAQTKKQRARATDKSPQRHSRRVQGLPAELSDNQPAPAGQGNPEAQERLESPPPAAATSAPRISPSPKPTESPNGGARSEDAASGTTLAQGPDDEPKVTVTDQEQHSEALATVATSYGDRTEDWVMNGSFSPGPMIENMRGRPALQPDSSISSRATAHRRLQGNKKSSAPKSNNASSSTPKESGSSNADYKAHGFRAELEKGDQGVQLFLHEYCNDEEDEESGVDDATEALLNRLHEQSYGPLADYRYQTDEFRMRLEKLEDKNERGVVRTLDELICPAAEDLAALTYRNTKLRPTYRKLVDLYSEPWVKTRSPLTGFKHPQPDHCVGFLRQAFSEPEWGLLDRVPEVTAAATDTMHFPFLTCEAKSSREHLFYADNQNAYSMMVAVSSAVRLFRAARMEASVHRKILAFSISYNNKHVSLDGFYPVIAGSRTGIYRKRIFELLISPGSSSRWQSWYFVRSIYEVWVPEHLNHLRAAINSPKLAVDLSRVPGRTSATPSPSDSAVRLQQLELQSPAPIGAPSDNLSEYNSRDRVRRAVTEPPVSDMNPKKLRTA
ncbi:uncharacterized protein BKCO1_680004 [Diplodia corticola]|uniref:DUF7924 domain-containing protein n=1 Tax=Diplodia corticola TaxID=236234 RepID=A0A1J9QNE6_9PEZI|nr:uncharacterized protein BKCO1_680004 [Diplodia corticola]OJD29984.1 hypothetical protein BKCO1_680004 [Diplodia corticola]